MLDPARIEEARRHFHIEGSEAAALDQALQKVVDHVPAMLPGADVPLRLADGSLWDTLVMTWPPLVMTFGGLCLGGFRAYRLILLIWFRPTAAGQPN